ncbi:MAG: transposase IS200-family protein [Phycisphaerales bacterium]|nr:transposase IS200-family protein [Phycisphaerales bacterium]
MGQTFTNLLVHCIFSTKGRAPTIHPDIAPKLFAYMGGIVRSIDGVALLINGVADHVHLLLSLPATLCASDAMRIVKANSSKWLHEEWPEHQDFAWQNGYGAFSVSRSSVEAVSAYIANQEVHHRRMTFQEELLAILKKHGIDYDERYIWE